MELPPAPSTPVVQGGQWANLLNDTRLHCYMNIHRAACDAQDTVGWAQDLDTSIAWLRPESKTGTAMKCETQWFTTGRSGVEYAYGPYKFMSLNLNENAVLAMLTTKVTELTGSSTAPDSLVANRYLTGEDMVPFHADDENMFLGKVIPIRIISLSLGATRSFDWKNKAVGNHTGKSSPQQPPPDTC